MANEFQQVSIPPTGTPEAVALSLLNLIIRTEGKVFDNGRSIGDGANVDRKWVLETYVQCLEAAKGIRP